MKSGNASAYAYINLLERLPEDKQKFLTVAPLKKQHPALYAYGLVSALHEQRTKFNEFVAAQLPLYESAVTIHLEDELQAGADNGGELLRISRNALIEKRLSPKEREKLAMRLMNLNEIIYQLERYLEALDNPHDDMAAHWLRDDTNRESNSNVLPLKR